VVAGVIIAGPHVRNAFRRHLDDLKRTDGIAGKQVNLQAAHTKLSHSKAFIVRAYSLFSAGR
jgi:hypothetical protein